MTITPAAAAVILQMPGYPGFVRITVHGGGCHGFEYESGFDRAAGEGDVTYSSNGVVLVTDPMSAIYLVDVEVDYERRGLMSAFVFNNPNASGTCGCGKSFSV